MSDKQIKISLPIHGLFKNLTGRKFGRLIVTGYAGRIGKSHSFACRCRCGSTIKTRSYCLTTGQTKSCGCLLPDQNKKRLTTHGLGGTSIWRIWSGMKTRCYNKKVKAYPRYGGTGIKVCKRWLIGEKGKSGFECFYADMGKRPSSDHSIDRYPDPFGDYKPSNCRWATDSEQARNTRKTKRITFAGVKKNAHEWAAETGIPAEQILRRLGRGWSTRRVLTQPLRAR